MLRKILIITVVLFVIASAIQCWAFFDEQEQRKLAIESDSGYAANINHYLKKYNQWLDTPEDQRPPMPWPNLEQKDKTPQQISQQQKNRLKADLPDLTSRPVRSSALYDMLYGEDWNHQVEKYKAKRELKELTCSVSSMFFAVAGINIAIIIIKILFDSFRKNFQRIRQPKSFAVKEPLRKQLLTREKTDIAKNNEHKPITRKENIHINSLLGFDKTHVENVPKNLITKAQLTGITQKDNDASEKKEKENNLIKSQNDCLEQQIKEFKKLTQDVKKHIPQKSQPVSEAIIELTQQVSAIREYASTQQERVTKLQQGYDWNIIRTFCLRIIRCIDQIEDKIKSANSISDTQDDLEDVKDELIFALESSGVEQFDPQINSIYLGQEKNAEAIKQKTPNDNPDLSGKIAEVIRPGYLYVIDEQNKKIVRPAQVKLFDSAKKSIQGALND